MRGEHIFPPPFVLNLSKDYFLFFRKEGEGQGFDRLSPNGEKVGEKIIP